MAEITNNVQMQSVGGKLQRIAASALAEVISRQLDKREKSKKTDQKSSSSEEDDDFYKIRKALLDADSSDPNGFERVLGKSDLVSINYLSRGLESSKAVCRIRVPGAGGGWYGTGFLVGPGLLITNNHVLGTKEDAAQAEAEFGYDHDSEGVLQPPIQFNLSPFDIFFTDIDLDITLVSVVPYSDGGVPLVRYGYLPLLPLRGKIQDGEAVTIIQHPEGQPKQMAIRASKIVKLKEEKDRGLNTSNFIHYTTDTEPGSSGAPVFNDQWQVVAIHHKAIPAPGQLGKHVKRIKWIANEGVRISALSELLERKRFSDQSVAAALAKLERAMGIAENLPYFNLQSSESDASLERDPKPFDVEAWGSDNFSSKLGYNDKFLGESSKISLSTIIENVKSKAAPLSDNSGHILDYLHFSTIVHSERKFPMLTAVNIKGDALVHPGGRNERFRIDKRMDNEFQPAANFYERKLGDDPVQFSRGHMVRRLDPCWGTPDEAKLAAKHTFHYSNSVPQVQGFNAGDWLNIEDYILSRAQSKERRMTVFSGPVFRSFDPEYGKKRKGGPWKIPVTFWKIVVVRKNGSISATAFMQGQSKFVEALFESRVFSNLRQKTIGDLQSQNLQTSITTIEKETGFDFSMLRRFDVTNALESTKRVRFLHNLNDIIL